MPTLELHMKSRGIMLGNDKCRYNMLKCRKLNQTFFNFPSKRLAGETRDKEPMHSLDHAVYTACSRVSKLEACLLTLVQTL